MSKAVDQASVTTTENNTVPTGTPTRKRGSTWNVQEAWEQGRLLKEAKTTPTSGTGTQVKTPSPSAFKESSYSARGKPKADVEIKYLALLNAKKETVVFGVTGLTFSIKNALSGDIPYNLNGVKTDNPLPADAYRSMEILQIEVKKGEAFIQENYPGAPPLDSMLPFCEVAIGDHNGFSFNIMPFMAQKDDTIKATWDDRVAAVKTMVLANEHTIRVEPAAFWVGRNHATWTEIEIDDDASNAFMLYREYKWALTGNAPKSAHRLEIAARDVVGLRTI